MNRAHARQKIESPFQPSKSKQALATPVRVAPNTPIRIASASMSRMSLASPTRSKAPHHIQRTPEKSKHPGSYLFSPSAKRVKQDFLPVDQNVTPKKIGPLTLITSAIKRPGTNFATPTRKICALDNTADAQYQVTQAASQLKKLGSPVKTRPLASISEESVPKLSVVHAEKGATSFFSQPRDKGGRFRKKSPTKLRLVLQPIIQEQPVEVELSEQTLECYEYISELEPFNGVIERFLLPRKRDPTKLKTLVLDLDETLVHTEIGALAASELKDLKDTFELDLESGGKVHRVCGAVRPRAREFVVAMSKHFEIVFFTASMGIYATKVIELLDPGHLVKHCLFRGDCSDVEGIFIKNLSLLGRNLKDVVIIDNMLSAFAYNLDNGINISNWYDDEKDTELMEVSKVLNECKDAVDVRVVLRNAYGLTHKYNDWAGTKKASAKE